MSGPILAPPAVTISSLCVEVVVLDVMRISWKISDTDEDLANFRFTLQRANAPNGPFEDLTPELVNQFEYFDRTPQMRSHFRKYYYRIRLRDARTSVVSYSATETLDSAPDFFLLEIRRRNDLYLKRFVGVPAAVLLAKTWGQRCGNCFDQIKQRTRTSQCRTCFNTGFVGGYFNQVDTYVNFSPNPEMVALLETGESQPVQSSMWLSHFPQLSPRDMIVEFPIKSEQRRWRVVTVGKTERLRATSRQIAQVAEINRTDIEYLVPVNKFIPPKDTFIGFRPPDGSGLL